MKKILVFIIVAFCFTNALAQYNFQQNKLPDEISILNFASLADAGKQSFTINQVRAQNSSLKFSPLKGKFANLGFTDHNFWLKFQLKNTLNIPIFYYLQTAEPITNNVNLYLIDEAGKINTQKSGDNLAFNKRSVAHRKVFFKIELAPGELKLAYLEVKNDGEKNNLPLKLLSQQNLLNNTYHDQLIMGMFYGILIIIAITYFFFYFALNEISFLYYSLYVTFVAICQFALDGFYHQYLGTDTSWLSLHAVILSAILSCFFFGKYSEIILEIKENNPILCKYFTSLYILLGAVTVGVVFIAGFLKFAYPIINILTVLGMFLIFITITKMMIKRQKIDRFYSWGIFILFICLILAVLMNFGLIPENLSADNITKPGIGLEIIALSLSMANRIGLLKTRQEELQTIALQKSEEMNDVKSYFLSNMSHELRTPLNAIVGLASIMESETNDPKFKSNCENILYASHGLMSSVNDILDFSKIEKGELELEHNIFNPLEIMQKLGTRMGQEIEIKGLAFDYYSSLNPETLVIGDKTRLEQIVQNILSNALKFTLKGKITFETKSRFENNILTLTILISDTGVGIPKQKLKSVFGLFSQTTHDHKRKFGGFGIGLSIVKALVDLHNGKITLESTENIGTNCEIILDYQIVIPEQINLNTPEVKPLSKGNNILIVEDNPMNQMVLEMMLDGWEQTNISIANDGAECLEIIKKTNIDLILMDLQMPVMDGFEAIEAIRGGKAGDENIQMPIIVVTADITKPTKERIFDLGANDYMNKPVEQNTLYTKITSVLSKRVIIDLE